MRPLLSLLLILGASLCFFAGYTIGKKHRYKDFTSAPVETKAVNQTEEDLPATDPAEIEVPPAIVEAPKLALPAAPDPMLLAKRAQQKIITLKDNQARAIQVELLEVKENSISLRRQSDFRIVEVPVNMLCPEDQALAAYLWAEKNPTPKGQMDSLILWEEIF